jgi:alanine dehydrogenase
VGDLRISDGDIERALTVDDFLASCDEAFRLYGSGEMVNHVREEEVCRKDGEERFRLELAAEWKGRYRCRKVIEERSDVRTGRLGEREARIELTEHDTGRRVTLDAEAITNMRTGAAGALAVRYLGPRQVKTVALLGTGRIARALALCVDAAVGPDEIRVTSRKPENREAFRRAVKAEISSGLTVCESVAHCVAGAEVVLTAVPTPRPVLTRADVAEDALVCAIAGDPRTNQLGMDLLCSRQVVVDQAEQARNSGDFVAAASAGRAGDVQFERGDDGREMTMGDAALGRLDHMRGTGSICYLTGMAVQDLHAAVTVMTRLPGMW